MSNLAPTLTGHLFLANQQLFHHLGDHFRQETATVSLSHLMILATIVLLFFAAIWFLQRLTASGGEKPRSDEQGLFNELCQQHQLTDRQIDLLRQVARRRCDNKGSRLFVDPSLLRAHADEESGETARQLLDLGSRFFGLYLFQQSADSPSG